MPEITVVITTYNLETYIGACLEELFSGTYQDFDVVLVDDCSKDKTVSIIKAYAEKFPGRIHSAFLQKNLGSPAKTRNWALDSGFIDGKYVVFLDGDDSLEPEYLEKLHTLALQNGADVAVCAYDRVEEGSGRVLCTEMQGFPALMTLPPEDDTLAFINGALWNKLFRSDIALAHRIPDFKVGEDLCYQQAIYRDCSSIACTDEVLIHYRVRTASVISNTEERTIRCFAEELARQYHQAQDPAQKDTIGLLAFIHIGISMALRAADNPQINLHAHLKWTARYLKDHYGWLRRNRWMRLQQLRKREVKGIALWGCRLLYRLGCFRLFLWCYRGAVRLFHVDFKF